MYYIYHIPDFIQPDGSIGKIGVSTEPKRRVKYQGYSEFEILEEHTCIYEASRREQQLQKEYGYRVDEAPYYMSFEQLKKARESFDIKAHMRRVGKKHGKENWKKAYESNMKTGQFSKAGLISSKHKRVLTYVDAEVIRKLYSSKEYTQYELADMYKTSQGVISQIIRNLTYTTP